MIRHQTIRPNRHPASSAPLAHQPETQHIVLLAKEYRLPPITTLRNVMRLIRNTKAPRSCHDVATHRGCRSTRPKTMIIKYCVPSTPQPSPSTVPSTQAIHRNPGSWAAHFVVRDPEGRIHELDLGCPAGFPRSANI